MLNKKGDWDAPRSLPTIIIGLLVLAMGLFPLLNQFGVLSFNLPYTPAGLVLAIILTLGGGWLMIVGFMEDDFIRIVSVILGIIVLILGALPILGQIGIVLPLSFLGFLYSPYLYTLVGLLLVIASFAVQ
jgi:hypothetical protein